MCKLGCVMHLKKLQRFCQTANMKAVWCRSAAWDIVHKALKVLFWKHLPFGSFTFSHKCKIARSSFCSHVFFFPLITFYFHLAFLEFFIMHLIYNICTVDTDFFCWAIFPPWQLVANFVFLHCVLSRAHLPLALFLLQNRKKKLISFTG